MEVEWICDPQFSCRNREREKKLSSIQTWCALDQSLTVERRYFCLYRPSAVVIKNGWTVNTYYHMFYFCLKQSELCPAEYTDHASSVVGRPVSCQPLDSFFAPSDWTRHDCSPAASIRKWQKAAGEPGITASVIWWPLFKLILLRLIKL